MRRRKRGVPRLFGLLLLLYPRSFRTRFGPAMRETFAEELTDARARGRGAVVAVWARAALGMPLLALEEHGRAVGIRRSSGGHSGGMEMVDRQSRRGMWHGASLLDIKLGARMLVKYPGLTLVGVVAMAVAVALATAWWEFSSNLLNPQLPIEAGDRIVRIQNWDAEAGGPEPRSLHDFEIWQREVRTVEDLAASDNVEYRIRTMDWQFATAGGARITPSAFRMLGAEALLGRTLLESDKEAEAPPVVVIGYDLWQRLFNGDQNIIGRDVRIGRTMSTVVGVMPEGFAFPFNQEMWVAFGERAVNYGRREGPTISIAGRIAPGVSLEEAQAELGALGRRAAADYPVANENLRPRVIPYAEFEGLETTVAGVANIVFVLLLFIVCANIGTLVFARTITRGGEIALRTALGASRPRIVFQLFTEALVLTTIASVIGLAGAAWGMHRAMDLFWEVQEMRPPFWFDVSVSVSTAAYVAALALFGAAVIGVLPALKATGQQLRSHFSAGGSGGEALRFGAVSTGVIVVQVALCVALFPIAVLAGQDLLPERGLAEQFAADAYLSGRLVRDAETRPGDLPAAERQALLGRASELQAEVGQRLLAEPGIAALTFADRLPGMNHPTESYQIESDAGIPDSVATGRARTLAVDVDFLRAMGARTIAGRTFHPSDPESAANVVVIGRSFAERVLGGRNAVGQRLRYPERQDEEGVRWHEIVGVVEDPPIVTYGAGTYVGVYRPLAPGRQAAVQLFVRASSRAAALESRIHEVVESVDADLAMDGLATLEETWRPVRRTDRLVLVALGVVCGMALLLSLAGIYALMSFTVAQRVREIAVRAALGAHPRRILLSIFSRAFMQIASGVLAGALLSSLTIVDNANGAKTVAAVAALMLTVGLLACALPAIRALSIEPADALREG